MKEHMDWFLERLVSGMPQEDAQQIARLILWYQDEERRRKEISQEDGIHSAMLADICETFFGHGANGEFRGNPVPRILSHTHAGWACGPGTGKDVSWLRTAMMLWDGKKGLTEDQATQFQQWEDFLEKLFLEKLSIVQWKLQKKLQKISSQKVEMPSTAQTKTSGNCHLLY